MLTKVISPLISPLSLASYDPHVDQGHLPSALSTLPRVMWPPCWLRSSPLCSLHSPQNHMTSMMTLTPLLWSLPRIIMTPHIDQGHLPSDLSTLPKIIMTSHVDLNTSPHLSLESCDLLVDQGHLPSDLSQESSWPLMLTWTPLLISLWNHHDPSCWLRSSFNICPVCNLLYLTHMHC